MADKPKPVKTETTVRTLDVDGKILTETLTVVTVVKGTDDKDDDQMPGSYL